MNADDEHPGDDEPLPAQDDDADDDEAADMADDVGDEYHEHFMIDEHHDGILAAVLIILQDTQYPSGEYYDAHDDDNDEASTQPIRHRLMAKLKRMLLASKAVGGATKSDGGGIDCHSLFSGQTFPCSPLLQARPPL